MILVQQQLLNQKKINALEEQQYHQDQVLAAGGIIVVQKLEELSSGRTNKTMHWKNNNVSYLQQSANLVVPNVAEDSTTCMLCFQLESAFPDMVLDAQ